MRSAERAKIWSAVQNAPRREVQLVSFSFSEIPGIKDGVLQFRSPITAICGINGTGKSSLLRAIWVTLNHREIEEHPEIKERLKSFSAELALHIQDQPVTVKLNEHEQPPAIKVVHIDPSTRVGQLQRLVCMINELDELIESHAPIVLEESEIRLLNAVLNKSYEAASIYEVDDYEEAAPFPFVAVSESGVAYDLRTMSLGEISVFNVFWALHRAEKNSIVLLEEPETFLSPVSQGAFLDYLAAVCVRKQLTLVMTTHSPQMFSRLTVDQVQFAYRTFDGAALANDSDFSAMREAVGIKPFVDRILLFEDRAARELTLNILRKRDHKTLLRSELISLNGHGDITKTCQVLPQVTAFRIVGIYDGDAYTKVMELNPNWPLSFLPGDEPVEEMFKDVIQTNAAAFAARLGRTENQLAIILGKLTGLEYHDWFEELAKSLHVSYSELMHACFEQWILDPWVQAHIDNFLLELEKTVG